MELWDMPSIGHLVKDCVFYIFHFFQQDQVPLFSCYSLGPLLSNSNDELFIIQTIKYVKYEQKK